MVQKMDMLHASDYANMGFGQMNHRIDQSRKNDAALAKSLQCVSISISIELYFLFTDF